VHKVLPDHVLSPKRGTSSNGNSESASIDAGFGLLIYCYGWVCFTGCTPIPISLGHEESGSYITPFLVCLVLLANPPLFLALTRTGSGGALLLATGM
jgi:hypothetical protein